ncbi:cell wall metabolism sensor histidine kinase WalK [Mesobacillus maritimus]|uniref:cell wall metabolism sensor histidine kinase WalK n=1 Tax=Mesobacillus maritimus TaxID=1643336 RepID=UPI002040B0FB|nr:cell wall metabolism sensor histidine kinase WalK [Mesobacillus maritimus]MCM3668366.1 cell wall metabolism sensor histidine kinase WalK [Mesobacillus maritimus]
MVSRYIKSRTEQDYYLHLINREAGRMGKLVSDLLDLSRMDAGQLRLEKHPFPLGSYLKTSFKNILMC